MTERNIGDISKYNVIRNYAPLKNHFDGMVIRIGYRGYNAGVIKEDPLFKEHMKGVLREGIPYGFYFMGQAVTESEAIAEAEYCHEMTRGYSPLFPAYFDSELSNPKGNGRAGVYASKSWFETRLYAGELENTVSGLHSITQSAAIKKLDMICGSIRAPTRFPA